MRISDWSSDVCSSDLGDHGAQPDAGLRTGVRDPTDRTRARRRPGGGQRDARFAPASGSVTFDEESDTPGWVGRGDTRQPQPAIFFNIVHVLHVQVDDLQGVVLLARFPPGGLELGRAPGCTPVT